jgi:DMSO/TMAO reductase YedYZ molybdopterin-dependent catalytic subunit
MRSQVQTKQPTALRSQPLALSRRQLVARLSAAGLSAAAVSALAASPLTSFAQEATPEGTPTPEDLLRSLGKSPDLIPYSTTNFGTPEGAVDGLYTPNELFFIRSNGPVSIDIPAAEWRLSVTGLVDSPLDLTLEDLQALPNTTVSVSSFLECSGNSRSRFGTDVEGTQWGNTAIGNAEWTGVPLAAVLDQAGVQEGAVDVVSQGGDFPEMQRGLPMDKALDPNTLIVWEMNGEPLPAPNGGPVRLLVPGWGGIASTKWLVGLEVIDQPFQGHYNIESYVIINEDEQAIRPVTTMPVKSFISEPAPGDTLSAGSLTVAGYAWSGYAGIGHVEVSTDGGATWADADITLEAGPLSWVRFEYLWNASAGDALLRSRAYDLRGLTQPDDVPWNARGYQMNAVYEVPVTVG